MNQNQAKWTLSKQEHVEKLRQKEPEITIEIRWCLLFYSRRAPRK